MRKPYLPTPSGDLPLLNSRACTTGARPLVAVSTTLVAADAHALQLRTVHCTYHDQLGQWQPATGTNQNLHKRNT